MNPEFQILLNNHGMNSEMYPPHLYNFNFSAFGLTGVILHWKQYFNILNGEDKCIGKKIEIVSNVSLSVQPIFSLLVTILLKLPGRRQAHGCIILQADAGWHR